MLDEGEIDVAVGGFTEDNAWVDEVGLTRPYTGTHVMMVPMGENALQSGSSAGSTTTAAGHDVRGRPGGRLAPALRPHRAAAGPGARAPSCLAARGGDARLHADVRDRGLRDRGGLPGDEDGVGGGRARPHPAAGLPRGRTARAGASGRRPSLWLPPLDRGRPPHGGGGAARRRAAPDRGLGHEPAARGAPADRDGAPAGADLLGRVADGGRDGLHGRRSVRARSAEAAAVRAAPRQGAPRGRRHAEGRLDDRGRDHRRSPRDRRRPVVGRRRGRRC